MYRSEKSLDYYSCLFICGLFNDAVSSSDFLVSNNTQHQN
jgi:hypothetical protein